MQMCWSRIVDQKIKIEYNVYEKFIKINKKNKDRFIWQKLNLKSKLNKYKLNDRKDKIYG